MIEDIAIEIARIEREARERVREKLAARQLGEAWVGLPVGKESGHESQERK